LKYRFSLTQKEAKPMDPSLKAQWERVCRQVRTTSEDQTEGVGFTGEGDSMVAQTMQALYKVEWIVCQVEERAVDSIQKLTVHLANREHFKLFPGLCAVVLGVNYPPILESETPMQGDELVSLDILMKPRELAPGPLSEDLDAGHVLGPNLKD
jgi:hypothetical protein